MASSPAADRPIQAVVARHLGDAVMALPALRALADALPQREVRVLARGPGADALRGQGRWRIVDALGRGPAVLFSPSLRVALGAVAAGASPRIGLAGDGRRPLLTHVVPGPSEPLPARSGGRRLPRLLVAEHQGDAWRRVAETAIRVFGGQAAEPDDAWVPSPEAEERGRRAWEEVGRPRVVVHPCVAGAATKGWGRWRDLVEDLGDACVVTGGPSPGDAALVEAVGGLGLAGDRALPVDAWAALAVRAGTVVAPDTGVGHLARAAGARVISLFGASDPVRHAPRGPGGLQVLSGGAGLECAPCYRDACHRGDHACMVGIPVEAVLSAVGGPDVLQCAP